MALPNELSLDLGLPQMPFTKNPELFGELQRVYNALRTIARAFDSYNGILKESIAYYSQLNTSKLYAGMNSRFYLVAGENISSGNIVGIDPNGQAYKSEDGVLQTIGFCSSPGTIPAGAHVEIQLFGLYPAYSTDTLTPGDTLYTSFTPGVIGTKASAPAWEQPIGVALTARQLYFNPQYVKI